MKNPTHHEPDSDLFDRASIAEQAWIPARQSRVVTFAGMTRNGNAG